MDPPSRVSRWPRNKNECRPAYVESVHYNKMCLSRIFTALDRYLSLQRTDRGILARKYLLGEYDEYDDSMTHVPEGCIYVEEWVKDDQVRRRVVYELEEITPFIGNPFDPVKMPWKWIGDASTGVDITDAVGRYVMAGNEIRLDLVLLFLAPHVDMDIVYVTSSGREVVFPNSGVKIVRDGSA